MFSSHILNAFIKDLINSLHVIKNEVINDYINPTGVDTSDINDKAVKSRLVCDKKLNSCKEYSNLKNIFYTW